MITKEKQNEFMKRAYQIAKEHGFHKNELSIEHYLMLVITEISEVIDADRHGRNLKGDLGMFEDALRTKQFKYCFEEYVKDSVEDELADVCIRIYDMCYALNIHPTTDVFDFENNEDDFANKSLNEKCYCLCCILCDREDYDYDTRFGCALAMIYYICDLLKVDIETHIKLKMQYNETRPYRNGKKY